MTPNHGWLVLPNYECLQQDRQQYIIHYQRFIIGDTSSMGLGPNLNPLNIKIVASDSFAKVIRGMGQGAGRPT